MKKDKASSTAYTVVHGILHTIKIRSLPGITLNYILRKEFIEEKVLEAVKDATTVDYNETLHQGEYVVVAKVD